MIKCFLSLYWQFYCLAKAKFYHIFEFFVSMKYFLYYICRSLISVELTLYHILESFVNMKLKVLYHVCRLLVGVECGFSIVDFSACASLSFALFSFSIFDFLVLGTSIYPFFYRSRLLFFSIRDFLAFVASTHQTFRLFFVIIVFKETLKCWFVFIVVGKLDQDYCLIIFKDPKVSYLNNFFLILDMNLVDCLAIVTH